MLFNKVSETQFKIPVGGANKKVIESANPSPNESRENSDDEMPMESETAQEEWESELMLKDSAWSLAKGKKTITHTSLELQHHSNFKL